MKECIHIHPYIHNRNNNNDDIHKAIQARERK